MWRLSRNAASLVLLFLAAAGCRRPSVLDCCITPQARSQPASRRAGADVTVPITPAEAAQGERLFQSYGCALCHGEDGGGNGRLAKTLPNPPRDLRDRSRFKQGTSVAAIASTIENGVPGTGMPAQAFIPAVDRDRVAGFILSLAATAPAPPPLAVTGAWVTEVPPGARVSAAYLTIENPSAETRELVGGSTNAARVVEIHEMKMEKGMMKMTRIPSLAIPAKGSAVLKPGGYHLMLIDLKIPLHKGDAVLLTLDFADGSHLQVAAPVRPFESH